MTAGKGVPAERRRVGMVFQDGALFPHRNVINNVNYGIVRGPARDHRAREALRLVGLADKHDRMPGTLSGGEQQRVALARALAPEPGVVLLDEPFASLDAALRVQLRDEVRRLLTDVGVTTILVTHDQEEAMSFGDRVAVMHAGARRAGRHPGGDLHHTRLATAGALRRRSRPAPGCVERKDRRHRTRHDRHPAVGGLDRDGDAAAGTDGGPSGWRSEGDRRPLLRR